MAGRATVVGAAGFVGARLAARLQADGWQVFAPAKRDPDLFRRELGALFYCAGLTADYDARPFDTGRVPQVAAGRERSLLFERQLRHEVVHGPENYGTVSRPRP